MRDHTSGQRWDNRTLEDLNYMVLRVSCRGCRHSNLMYPADLLVRFRNTKRTAWPLLIPRFKCSVCGEKQAVAEAHALPR